MKTKILMLILALVSAPAMAASTVQQVSLNNSDNAHYDAADQEMIKLLLLREEQVNDYVRIMQLQRRAFLAVSETQWDKKIEVYEDTVNKLKPLLNDAQIAQFTAYMGCLIEEHQQYTHLSME